MIKRALDTIRFIRADNLYLFKKNVIKTVANTEDVEFINEIEPLKKEIKKLRDGGVNIIIAIGHSGINIDKIVIKEVEGIDLVVSSHSHTFLYSGKRIFNIDYS